jgi:hypothetical protein
MPGTNKYRKWETEFLDDYYKNRIEDDLWNR